MREPALPRRADDIRPYGADGHFTVCIHVCDAVKLRAVEDARPCGQKLNLRIVGEGLAPPARHYVII